MNIDNKYKDVDPQITINKIQNILVKLGLNVTYSWSNDESIKDCYSVRITINELNLGSNGKGASRLYALASGYSELMERLQNGVLWLPNTYFEKSDKYFFPDEKLISIKKLAECDNSFIQFFKNKLKCNSCAEVEEKLRCERHSLKNFFYDDLLTVPFFDIKNNKVEYLPLFWCYDLYLSNGMCSGNTPQEAIVQGISEILERNAIRKILDGEILKTIPNEFIKKFPELYEKIKIIESTNKYKVIVKDCSFDFDCAVVATIIVNKETSCFGVNMGAHPSFEIALERTFTEAFQGRNLEQFTSSNKIGTFEEAKNRENFLNIAKCNMGVFPPTLFLDNEKNLDYALKDNCKSDNGKLLKKLVSTIENKGYDIFIRNVSFLGFPSYYIIIPGLSEVRELDSIHMKLINMANYLQNEAKTLSDKLSNSTLEVFINYIRAKNNSWLENTMSVILGRPIEDSFLFESPIGTQIFAAICLYKIGKKDESIKWLKNIISTLDKSDKHYMYIKCAHDYLKYCDEKLNDEQIKEILYSIYAHEIVDAVLPKIKNKEKLIENVYPKMNCFNCDECNLKCGYNKRMEFLARLRDISSSKNISQDSLRELFEK